MQSNKTVKKLKDELRKRKASIQGKKADLVERRDDDDFGYENTEELALDIKFKSDALAAPADDKTNVLSSQQIANDTPSIEIRPVLICDSCNETFTDFRSLIKHMKQHSAMKTEASKATKRRIKCEICSKRFSTGQSLQSHMRRTHGPDKEREGLRCEPCGETYHSREDFRIHESVHSGADGRPGRTCSECGKTFASPSVLRRHLYRHMSHRRYACGACGKSFVEQHDLRRHARTHTGEALHKRHKCNTCHKRYSTPKELETHMRRHLDDRPHACATCGKRFMDARLLGSHLKTHSTVKPYPCTHCDKRFRHASTQRVHERTHTGEKPFVCSACGKAFIQSSNLTLHMRSHSGAKPYGCEECGRQFSSCSSLKTHARTHTGEKPYACPVCLERFARPSLSAHMRSHSGARPHTCALCTKTFSSARTLRDHRRLHTGDRPFECERCHLKFSTKYMLRRHHKNAKDKTEKPKQASTETVEPEVVTAKKHKPKPKQKPVKSQTSNKVVPTGSQIIQIISTNPAEAKIPEQNLEDGQLIIEQSQVAIEACQVPAQTHVIIEKRHLVVHGGHMYVQGSPIQVQGIEIVNQEVEVMDQGDLVPQETKDGAQDDTLEHYDQGDQEPHQDARMIGQRDPAESDQNVAGTASQKNEIDRDKESQSHVLVKVDEIAVEHGQIMLQGQEEMVGEEQARILIDEQQRPMMLQDGQMVVVEGLCSVPEGVSLISLGSTTLVRDIHENM